MHNFDKSILDKISPQLSQYKHNRGIHNFRCLYCGDSNKNKYKARGYIFESKTQNLIIKCHNCSIAVSFNHFLSDFFPELHKEYKFNKFRSDDTYSIITPILLNHKIYKPDIFQNFKVSLELHKNDLYKSYILKRKIPSKFFKDIFLVPDFKKFTNNLIPDKFVELFSEDPRLVVPLILNGELIGYQGRTIEPSNNLRYITIMLDNSKPKVWGFDNVDKTANVFITEGIFDAMFIPNSIAMLGSDLPIEFLKKCPDTHFIFIYDNENRNPQIIKRMLKIIDLGFSVVIWNKSIIAKDVNEYVLSGGSVNDIICNVYKGARAKLELIDWCK